jgi:hypothetical protein
LRSCRPLPSLPRGTSPRRPMRHDDDGRNSTAEEPIPLWPAARARCACLIQRRRVHRFRPCAGDFPSVHIASLNSSKCPPASSDTPGACPPAHRPTGLHASLSNDPRPRDANQHQHFSRFKSHHHNASLQTVTRYAPRTCFVPPLSSERAVDPAEGGKPWPAPTPSR